MAVPSTMLLEIGASAPDFSLPAVDGRTITRDEFRGREGLIVVFVCNHCPFVIHVKEELARLYQDFGNRGVGMVAINANDTEAYPEDSFDKMKEFARDNGWGFPYLFDASQQVAKAYGAACTPDTFLFDHDLRLVYRGQLDDSRPGTGTPVTGQDVRSALESMLAGRPVGHKQKPSLGCSIKWKPGNAPGYFG